MWELDPTIDDYKLVFGLIRDSPDEIAVLTSSVVEIMRDLVDFFDAPAEDVDLGWTTRSVTPPEDDPLGWAPIQVAVTGKRPDDLFVTVRSRDWWFSIREADLQSKKMFSLLMVLLQLAEGRDRPVGPAVTIGAG